MRDAWVLRWQVNNQPAEISKIKKIASWWFILNAPIALGRLAHVFELHVQAGWVWVLIHDGCDFFRRAGLTRLSCIGASPHLSQQFCVELWLQFHVGRILKSPLPSRKRWWKRERSGFCLHLSLLLLQLLGWFGIMSRQTSRWWRIVYRPWVHFLLQGNLIRMHSRNAGAFHFWCKYNVVQSNSWYCTFDLQEIEVLERARQKAVRHSLWRP